MSGTKQNVFSQIWSHPTNRKFLMLVGGVVVLAGGYVMFGGSKPQVNPSNMPLPPSGGGGTPLTSPMSDAYVKSLAAADAERARQAESHTGTAVSNPASSIVTPVKNDPGKALPTSLDGTQERPKDMVKPPAPTLPPPQVNLLPQPTPKPPQDQAPKGPTVDQNLMNAMLKEMAAIDKANQALPAKTEWFASAQQKPSGAAGMGGQYASAQGMPGQIPGSQVPGASVSQVAAVNARVSRFKAPAAGTILYARLVGRVNSDVPGPVIAELLQGPFTGSRVLGSFQFSEEGVLISFSAMTVPFTEDGQQKSEVMPIKAVAVDSANLGTAMASNIDRHVLERIAVGAATSFLAGLGQAIGSSGSTAVIDPTGTTVISNPSRTSQQLLWQAGGTAAAKAGQIFDQVFGNRKTTITVDADTPFGLLFLPESSN